MKLTGYIGILIWIVIILTWLGASVDYDVWRIEIDKFAVVHNYAEGKVGFMAPLELDYMISAYYYNGAYEMFFFCIKLVIFLLGIIIPTATLEKFLEYIET